MKRADDDSAAHELSGVDLANESSTNSQTIESALIFNSSSDDSSDSSTDSGLDSSSSLSHDQHYNLHYVTDARPTDKEFDSNSTDKSDTDRSLDAVENVARDAHHNAPIFHATNDSRDPNFVHQQCTPSGTPVRTLGILPRYLSTSSGTPAMHHSHSKLPHAENAPRLATNWFPPPVTKPTAPFAYLSTPSLRRMPTMSRSGSPPQRESRHSILDSEVQGLIR